MNALYVRDMRSPYQRQWGTTYWTWLTGTGIEGFFNQRWQRPASHSKARPLKLCLHVHIDYHLNWRQASRPNVIEQIQLRVSAIYRKVFWCSDHCGVIWGVELFCYLREQWRVAHWWSCWGERCAYPPGNCCKWQGCCPLLHWTASHSSPRCIRQESFCQDKTQRGGVGSVTGRRSHPHMGGVNPRGAESTTPAMLIKTIGLPNW